MGDKINRDIDKSRQVVVLVNKRRLVLILPVSSTRRCHRAWLNMASRTYKLHVLRLASYNFARYSSKHGPPLRDRHGRDHTYLRISLTERCNLRCKFELNIYLPAKFL